MSERLLAVKKRIEGEQKVHWSSMVSQAKLFFLIQKRIALAQISGNDYKYIRAVDALINSMFKEDRDKIAQYQKQLIELNYKKIDRYRLVTRKCVDLLEPYLRQFFTPADSGDMYDDGTEEKI